VTAVGPGALEEVRHRLAVLAELPGVGVDVEEIERWTSPDLRVFTAAERAYCLGPGRSAERFAGRWCAKEAVVKAVAPFVAGSLRDVEILADVTGRPLVHLSPRLVHLGLDVTVSITHSTTMAVAIAVAVRT